MRVRAKLGCSARKTKHAEKIFAPLAFLAIIAGFLASAGACYGQSAVETLRNQSAGMAAAADTVKFAKGLSADHKHYHPHATKDCALLDPYFFINGGKFDAAGHAQDMERDRQNCPICNPPKPTVQPTQPPTPAPTKEKARRLQAQKPIVQPLPPPASTKDVDRLHDELSQRDRTGTFQDAKSATKTDEAIPTTQKESGGKSSVSDALDGLSDAYGEKKGVDALTQVFGPLPTRATPSDAPTALDPDSNHDSLQQVFGPLPTKTDGASLDRLPTTASQRPITSDRIATRDTSTTQWVVNDAQSAVGSDRYAVNKEITRFGMPFPAGISKCNLFVHDVLFGAGLDAPTRPVQIVGRAGAETGTSGVSFNAPLLAAEWADTKRVLPGYPITTDKPKPGDIVAAANPTYSDASGHMGIVSKVVTGSDGAVRVWVVSAGSSAVSEKPLNEVFPPSKGYQSPVFRRPDLQPRR